MTTKNNFHAFISYNSSNTIIAEELYEYLKNSSLAIFFDKKHQFSAEKRNQVEIDEALKASKSLRLE